MSAGTLDSLAVGAATAPVAGRAVAAPRAALPDEQRRIELLTKAVAYAVLAPSSHNAQPWRFRIRLGALELLLDRSRALPVADPACRELMISCGAALQNLRVALRHWGFAATIETLPYASNPDVLFRVELNRRKNPSRLDELLFGAIPDRRTSRGPFIAAPISPRLIAAFERAAELERAWLRRVGDGVSRDAAAALIAEASRRQWASADYRRELATWLRADGDSASDGIPGPALGLSTFASRLAPAVVRWMSRGGAQSRRDRALALEAPLLVILGTPGDTPRDWLAAGRALQLVLLVAASHGVSASFLNQPIQVPALRARLAEALGGTGSPQLILRLGYAAVSAPTPRRAVREVLV